MKKTAKLLLASVATLGLLSSVYAADLKVATVNVAKVLQSSSVVSKAKSSLQAKYKPQYNNIETAQKKMVADINNLKKNSETMSASARKTAQNNIAQEQQTLIAQQQQFQQQLTKAQQQTMQAVLSRLQTVIAKIAQQNGYTLVLPKDAVAYAASNLDITPQVLKSFDASGALPGAAS
ncbi:MAG: hypothetical protein CMF39_02760 [Legionellaceae bacterium]|nr:hypothetical protein [Legionellaceae bacterium]